nr:YegP family protein [Microbacterium hydrocarbonoxydans]
MADPLFAVRKSSNGQFYFYLRAENSKIVATSEMYTTKAAAFDGIKAVQRLAPIAVVLDMTEDN